MDRAERLARNEAVFRDVNEQIRIATAQYVPDGHVYAFICECSDVGCAERVMLSVPEYEAIRASSRRFVLAKGHVCDAVETVVAVDADHVVVEKTGVAGHIAAALDPRAA